MRHINKFILSLLINLIVIFSIPVLFGANIINLLYSNGPWILPLLVVLSGVFFGWVISLLFGKDKNEFSYLSGQIISCIGLLIILTIVSYKHQDYQNNFSNIESNNDVMKYFVSETEPYVKIAFKKLESSFSNPNDFSLNSFHVRKTDTSTNNIVDTVYTVYFTYSRNEKKGEWLSKLNVFQSNAELQYINLPAHENKEYQAVKQSFTTENKQQIEEAEKVINQMHKKGDQFVIDSIDKKYK